MTDPYYAPSNQAAALAEITGIQRCVATPEYSAVVTRLSDNTDLSPYVNVDGDAVVNWNCDNQVPASLRLNFKSTVPALKWGSERVAVTQLIRSAEWNAKQGRDLSTWSAFPVARFVLTTPGIDDMDRADLRPATGYDLNYLLQSEPANAINFDYGTTYANALVTVFNQAGIPGALSTFCDYPGDWTTKTLPAPMPFPADSDSSYLSIANELLRSSGCDALYVNAAGRWQIRYSANYATQNLSWRWAASSGAGVDADLVTKAVLFGGTSYSGDVYNVPNQWVFVQQGLTFQPIEGSGMYTVNNKSVPPSDQLTVGRVLRSTQFLQASGQDDLKTQGDKIVSDAISQAEKLTISTAPWPIGSQYDLFQVAHAAFPYSPLRRAVAQSWSLPLFGGDMQWQANVVASL